MSSIFDVPVSLYHDVKDRVGRWVDPVTHQVVRSMNMADFLFGGYWQDEVEEYRERLRQRADEVGLEVAKHEPVIADIKKLLPAATLSGYFEQGRKIDLLTRHTGFIALDIDWQDNMTLTDEGVKICLRDRPETAAIIQSCSGTGFFVLVKLAHPDKMGEQFDALVQEYSRMGIFLDKGCRDVTRLRFASFDVEPYINERATPYLGLIDNGSRSLLQQRHIYSASSQQNFGGRTKEQTVNLVENLVQRAVGMMVNIAPSYDEWYKLAFALASVDGDLGREWYHRLSKVDGRYNQNECERQYRACVKQGSRTITVNYFLSLCSKYNVRLYERR